MKTLALLLLTTVAAAANPHEADVADLTAKLDGAAAAMAAGDADGASDATVRAFKAFEDSAFHGALAAKDHSLYRKLEADWLDLAKAYEANDPSTAKARRATLDADFSSAEKLFAEPPSPKSAAFNAFVILFREGFEALLILGAIAATLRKLGRREMSRVLWAGAGSAVVATGGLYALSLKVLKISGQHQEILEGATMLLAAAVLFWMSYWLISKIDGKRWQAFITENVKKALSAPSKGSGQSGNALALGSLAFLVVFREGFETVLMLRALEAGGAGWGPVLAGIGVATILLVGVFFAIIVAGLRLPIRAFFAGTSALLLALVFKFAGDGIVELQEGRVLSRTLLSWAPDSSFLRNWLGIHPTVESLALQALVLVLVAGGLAWTFLRKAPVVPPVALEPFKAQRELQSVR
ncbi:MAG: high-affinity Fe2+/Pb2+ [Planctomycetota bacterium]|nr:MAG: high-affinity Fe2+/Pb2+ [Planctomycetota bacterium]